MTTPPQHAGRAHALLSASSAHRWIHCTPAPHLEATHPDTTSPAAEEGTTAHELAEHKLRAALGQLTVAPESDWINEDMQAHTTAYADYVLNTLHKAQQQSPAAFLALEQRLDYSAWVPDGFGTGDAIIVADTTMTIIDLKYGKGVEVSAVGNPQMRLYALGALSQFGMIYTIDHIKMVIYQPRLDNISEDTISVGELTEWADTVVRPAAKAAAKGAGQQVAGAWCQFCRHAPQCAALAKTHFDTLPMTVDDTTDPPEPATLSDEQISTIITHSGELKKWLTSVEKYALDQANNGHTYPGMKLVEGRSIRRYTNETAVAEAVQQAGHDPYERKILGITAMTKLLGKKAFDNLVGDYLQKPPGKPTLVPSADKRPPLQPATPDTVFAPVEGGTM